MATIRTNFIYSVVLVLSNYLFPLLVYPYVSRVLGVANIGLCNFIDGIINYFILFSMMGINVVGIREVAKEKGDRTKLSNCFQDISRLNLLATSIVLIILIALMFTVPRLEAHRDLMWIGVFKLLANVFLIEWFYKGMEEFRFITFRSIIIKTICLIGIFIFVNDESDYREYYFFMCAMYAINAFFNWGYLRRFISFSFFKGDISRYSKTILIMGSYSILTSMYTTFNIAFLGLVSSDTEVGYYTTAVKLYSIIMALYSAFTGVMLPRMSALVAENRIGDFNNLLAKSNKILFKFTLPLIVYTIIFSPEIIQIISGTGYEGAVCPMRLVMPLMLIIGYEQIIIVQILMPLKKDKYILINSIIGAFTGIILNLLLVPSMKSVGSAIVWGTSEIIVMISAQFFVYKLIKKGIPLRLFIRESFYVFPLFLALVGLYCLYHYNFMGMIEYIILGGCILGVHYIISCGNLLKFRYA